MDLLQNLTGMKISIKFLRECGIEKVSKSKMLKSDKGMRSSPTRRGKEDPKAHYPQRAAELGIPLKDVLSCSVSKPSELCTGCSLEHAVHNNRNFCQGTARVQIGKS